METIKISYSDWSNLIDTVNEKSGVDMPVWKAMTTFYDICHESIITPLSNELMFLYRRLNGTNRETFDSFCKLPPKYIDAVEVIEHEINRIESFNNG